MEPELGEKVGSQLSKLTKGVGFLVIIAILGLLFVKSMVFIVKAEYQGVIVTLGKATRTVGPGIHFKLPWPLQSLKQVNVKQVRRVEIGYRTISAGPPAEYRDVPEESLMLTGDENIIEVAAAVQYVVADPITYLYRIDKPDTALRKAAESALREVVGRYTIDDVLVNNKALVQEESKRLLQQLADEFQMGIAIRSFLLQDVHPPEEVIDAFKDVASAKEDKQKYINEAEAYRSDLIPKARGQAEEIIQEAEAAKESRILRAQGDVAKFLEMYEEYVNSREVTRTRLYLETMEEVLAGKQIFIMSDEGGSVKLIPLGQYLGGDAGER